MFGDHFLTCVRDYPACQFVLIGPRSLSGLKYKAVAFHGLNNVRPILRRGYLIRFLLPLGVTSMLRTGGVLDRTGQVLDAAQLLDVTIALTEREIDISEEEGLKAAAS